MEADNANRGIQTSLCHKDAWGFSNISLGKFSFLDLIEIQQTKVIILF